jgi:hypothetical protein
MIGLAHGRSWWKGPAPRPKPALARLRVPFGFDLDQPTEPHASDGPMARAMPLRSYLGREAFAQAKSELWEREPWMRKYPELFRR